MSSVNFHYTQTYAQPTEYRYSHDSVFLARRVFEWSKLQNLSGWHALDLCAGCGVVGMDFLMHRSHARLNCPERFDFLEVQSIYSEFFTANARALNKLSKLRFLNRNYREMLMPEWQERYDLIVCNPPYFDPAHSKLSQSEFKNRCRFFIDSDFSTLIQSISNALKPNGSAFLLLRPQESHKINMRQVLQAVLDEAFDLQFLEPVRGTDLAFICRR